MPRVHGTDADHRRRPHRHGGGGGIFSLPTPFRSSSSPPPRHRIGHTIASSGKYDMDDMEFRGTQTQDLNDGADVHGIAGTAGKSDDPSRGAAAESTQENVERRRDQEIQSWRRGTAEDMQDGMEDNDDDSDATVLEDEEEDGSVDLLAEDGDDEDHASIANAKAASAFSPVSPATQTLDRLSRFGSQEGGAELCIHLLADAAESHGGSKRSGEEEGGASGEESTEKKERESEDNNDNGKDSSNKHQVSAALSSSTDQGINRIAEKESINKEEGKKMDGEGEDSQHQISAAPSSSTRRGIDNYGGNHENKEVQSVAAELKKRQCLHDLKEYFMSTNNSSAFAKTQSHNLKPPTVPFCHKCKRETGDCAAAAPSQSSVSLPHHPLCPRHVDFFDSGSYEILTLMVDGNILACDACVYQFDEGRPSKKLFHGGKCTRSKKGGGGGKKTAKMPEPGKNKGAGSKSPPGPGWKMKVGRDDKGRQECHWVSPARNIEFRTRLEACEFEKLRQEFGTNEVRAWEEHRKITAGSNASVIAPKLYDTGRIKARSRDETAKRFGQSQVRKNKGQDGELQLPRMGAGTITRPNIAQLSPPRTHGQRNSLSSTPKGQKTSRPPRAKGPFEAGTIVFVQDRTWPGRNDPGGVARILEVHRGGHGTAYDVKYILEPRKERGVEEEYVTPHADYVSPKKDESNLASHIDEEDCDTKSGEEAKGDCTAIIDNGNSQSGGVKDIMPNAAFGNNDEQAAKVQDVDENGHPLSEYERLRLHNIRRNQARLAQLELLAPPKSNNKDNEQSSSSKRGKAKSHKKRQPQEIEWTTQPKRQKAKHTEGGEEKPKATTSMGENRKEKNALSISFAVASLADAANSQTGKTSKPHDLSCPRRREGDEYGGQKDGSPKEESQKPRMQEEERCGDFEQQKQPRKLLPPPGPGWTHKKVAEVAGNKQKHCHWFSPIRNIEFRRRRQACEFEQLRRKFANDEVRAWEEFRKIKAGSKTQVVSPQHYDERQKKNSKKPPPGPGWTFKRVLKGESCSCHWLSPIRNIEFKRHFQACEFEQLRQKFGTDEVRAWEELRRISPGSRVFVVYPGQYDANPKEQKSTTEDFVSSTESQQPRMNEEEESCGDMIEQQKEPAKKISASIEEESSLSETAKAGFQKCTLEWQAEGSVTTKDDVIRCSQARKDVHNVDSKSGPHHCREQELNEPARKDCSITSNNWASSSSSHDALVTKRTKTPKAFTRARQLTPSPVLTGDKDVAQPPLPPLPSWIEEFIAEANRHNETVPAPRGTKWLPCPNPWGKIGHEEGDFVVLSPFQSESAGNALSILHRGPEGGIPKRFVANPLEEGSPYHATHRSPARGGYSVLRMLRDRMGLRPWGFTTRLHEFGGACLVDGVEPLSPAVAAEDVSGWTNEGSSSGLRFHDMIICINGKSVSSMTMPELQIELDVCGPELMLVVSRFDILETGENQDYTLEDLAMDWNDIWAGVSVKRKRGSFEGSPTDRDLPDVEEVKLDGASVREFDTSQADVSRSITQNGQQPSAEIELYSASTKQVKSPLPNPNQLTLISKSTKPGPKPPAFASKAVESECGKGSSHPESNYLHKGEACTSKKCDGMKNEMPSKEATVRRNNTQFEKKKSHPTVEKLHPDTRVEQARDIPIIRKTTHKSKGQANTASRYQKQELSDDESKQTIINHSFKGQHKPKCQMKPSCHQKQLDDQSNDESNFFTKSGRTKKNKFDQCPKNQVEDDAPSSSGEEEDEGSDENPWLGCVCGKTHPRPIKVFWIQCEGCDAWYNAAQECVGFDESAAEELEEWCCWACDPPVAGLGL